jgi:PRTRC genetic system protein A
MTVLADDPTAAAVLAAVPCYPVPPSGRSPAIDALRSARAGHGLAIGRNGVMLILRRPWLELDVPVASSMGAYLPYGNIGAPRADLRCGLAPGKLLHQIMEHFVAALPNEAAAFVIWDEATRAFSIDFPAIDDATPSRLVYRTPRLGPDQHIVCDIHSHGSGPAFFSATDDADDVHATKIAIVLGRIDRPYGPVTESRICAAGMFLPMPRSPFTGGDHAA